MNVFVFSENGSVGATIPICDPIAHVTKLDESIKVRIKTSFDLADISWADVLYLHRPIYPLHLEIIEISKRLKKKVILLIDDDLLSVPIDHPKYFFYKNVELKKRVELATMEADHVVFSNKEILNSFPWVENYSVVHCAYDDELIRSIEYNPDRKKIAYFRGSPTHRKSLLEYSDAIAECGAKHLDWTFIFIGDYPWYVVEKLKNSWYVVSDFMQPEKMWQYLKELRPAINFCPRTDNQFTRSRSDMAFMDATLCGAITLGPDWSLWRHRGVIAYKDVNGFSHEFNSAMNAFDGGDEFSCAIRGGKDFMLENRSYSYSAREHLKILKSI